MITVEEFQTYIDSFHKEKGQYTIEELLQIGVMFKSLPVKKRNWASLHQLLGIYNFSAEAYRHRVERYIRCNPDKIEPNIEGDIFRNDYLEKQKVRDWYNAYRRDIRQESRIENLVDEIKLTVDKLKNLPVIKYESKDDVILDKEAVLLLSDLHIGVDCNNYYNSYNQNIAKERLEKLLKETIDYCRSNHVKKLNILNLGDMIAGLIHSNARIEQQMDVAEQVMVAAEYISQFLNELQKGVPEVTYRSVYDNHSRLIANKNEHIEKEQLSKIIDWFIKERLKETNILFYDNDIDGGIGTLTLNNGQKMIFAHGHQDGRNSSYQNFIGLTQQWVDYICLAHYHNPASKDFQGCKVFINGSIVGTEQYAFGKRLFTKPSQKLLIFRKDSKTVQDIDINLE